MLVTKLLISPVKKRIFCPKTTQFGPKLAFLFIAGSFGALLVGWLVVVARAKYRKTPIYFMWVTKLLISPVKKGFFAQKRPNLAQNWHFCPLLAVAGLAGGCGARAVSRKTPIYFISCYPSAENLNCTT